jgi:predicted transcriptional regulator
VPMRFDDLHAQWLRDDPKYRAAHAALEDEFAPVSALIEARRHAGLTQEELAQRMGTSQTAIAREGPLPAIEPHYLLTKMTMATAFVTMLKSMSSRQTKCQCILLNVNTTPDDCKSIVNGIRSWK